MIGCGHEFASYCASSSFAGGVSECSERRDRVNDKVKEGEGVKRKRGIGEWRERKGSEAVQNLEKARDETDPFHE